ncbi:RBBP9/YdeN family alpha/beta hydrolase [Streptomyces sp. DSM 15324]|uniref:RBBP9/YdeN family alpha/beta hydrolase n=1 Tax=Streptomyces sp. DSM 15324 TaxID=1739111 RepID=UPI00074AB936|nr:alpha/beta hydrolase [Streptomyces sp. DSM 15324]KUO13757.1 hydrolase [Streptomyces sp. DSM 15324]
MPTTPSPTSSASPAFLVLHGWQNRRPEAHWQHWLADRLTALGHSVTYPQLPDPDTPSLEAWLTELEGLLADFGPAASERVVIAHSLSAVLWLHAAARDLPGVTAPDRVLLVAPPSASVVRSHPEIAEFAPPPLPGLRLPTPTHLVAGDDDPYLPEGAQAAYGTPLGLTADLLPGAAHLDLDAGYGPWPSVLEWCLDRTARLRVRP